MSLAPKTLVLALDLVALLASLLVAYNYELVSHVYLRRTFDQCYFRERERKVSTKMTDFSCMRTIELWNLNDFANEN